MDVLITDFPAKIVTRVAGKKKIHELIIRGGGGGGGLVPL